jgi:glycerophosphoryl diester phosphodiesterase
VSEESLARWKEAGFFVIPWTVNDPWEARRLLGLGVDGLIGDLPEVLLAARG